MQNTPITVGDKIAEHLRQQFPLGFDESVVKQSLIDKMANLDASVSRSTINRYYNTYLNRSVELPLGFFLAVEHLTGLQYHHFTDVIRA